MCPLHPMGTGSAAAPCSNFDEHSLGCHHSQKVFQFLKGNAKLLKKELVIKYLQFINQDMKFSFRVPFHKKLSHPKSFSLNTIISTFKMQAI